MAAVHTVLAGLTNTGDHIVCSNAVYGSTITLLKNIMLKYGVETTFVNSYDLNETRSAMRDNTKVVFIETPGNPTLTITDIEETAKIAHGYNAKFVVDNTFMSPVLQQPFSFGADIIVHSLTKFLNGHADVVGGVVIVRDEQTYQDFRRVLNQIGGVIDPFNSFLVHRGIKTLALRMQKHCENAMKIAVHLENHPHVKWVRYPGLESHPQYEIGKKQQKGPGGMISFELKGGLEAGKIVMNSVKLCKLAVSLGGVETLIQHPASMTHSAIGPENRIAANITEGLVRISVGIENADDLIEDLDNSLDAVSKKT
jgi:methionine-gamma-lyase